MTNPTDDFEDALAGDDPDFGSEPSSPLDLDQATQWVAKVAQARRKREEYREAHAAAVARLNARLAERMEALDQQEAWFTEALTIYHRTVLAADPEAKTIPTPAGTLKARKGQPGYSYEDEEALLAWAMENASDVVDVPPPPDPRVNKNRFKKAIKGSKVSDGVIIMPDGEPVPGVKVTDAEVDYKVVTD